MEQEVESSNTNISDSKERMKIAVGSNKLRSPCRLVNRHIEIKNKITAFFFVKLLFLR